MYGLNGIENDRAIACALEENERENYQSAQYYTSPSTIEGSEAFNYDKTLYFDKLISININPYYDCTKLINPYVNTSKYYTKEDVKETNRNELNKKIEAFELKEKEVPSDGNCQFSSLSDQLYRSIKFSDKVREYVINQLVFHKERYKEYIIEDYNSYISKMSRHGEWGDHITLQAASDYFGVKIWILPSYSDSNFIEIEPREKKSDRILFLSFWAEVHYNSLYPSYEKIINENKGEFGSGIKNLFRNIFSSH